MSLDSEVEALQRVPIFKDIDPAKLRLLAFISERITFSEGEALCTQGEEGDSAYVILEGDADVRVNIGGADKSVATLELYAIVGEIAILSDVPRTATVVANRELVALTVSKENFLKLMHEFPDMALEVMRVLATRLEKTTKDLVALQAKAS